MVLFSSVAQSCPTLWDPMDRSTPGLPVHHQLQEFTQPHLYWAGDAIKPSHPLLSPPLAFNHSQHQGLFQWVSSSHQGGKEIKSVNPKGNQHWILIGGTDEAEAEAPILWPPDAKSWFTEFALPLLFYILSFSHVFFMLNVYLIYLFLSFIFKSWSHL